MAIMTISLYSESLCRTVTMRAFLPVDGAGAAALPLKSLYLLHGLYGSENDWLLNTRVAFWARQKGLAVFCPAGENAFYLKTQGGADYLRFIGEELPVLTRKLFPLSHKREDTFVGGLSMGGYGALNVGFNYPETFGKVVGLSSAIRYWEFANEQSPDFVMRADWGKSLFGADPENWDTLSFAEKCGAERSPEIWLACGTEDDLMPANIHFAEGLKSCGIPVSFKQAPGAHEWDFWDREIHCALDWLIPDA